MTDVLLKKRSGHIQADTQERRPCQHSGRDKNDESTNQGIPRTAGSHQKLEKFLPRTIARGSVDLQHLDFTLLASRTMRE